MGSVIGLSSYDYDYRGVNTLIINFKELYLGTGQKKKKKKENPPHPGLHDKQLPHT